MAVGGEIDDTFVFIDVVNRADIEVAFRYLTDQLAFLLVVQIDVVVVVALAGPYDVFPVFEVVTVQAVVVHIFFVGFLNDAANLSCLGVKLQEAVGVVAALVEGEGHVAVVVLPRRGIHIILLLKEGGAWFCHLS